MPGEARRTGLRVRWVVVGLLALGVAALIAFWDWNWFRPLVEAQVSAALGRPVSLQHFDLEPGRQTVVVADGVTVGDPPSSPAGTPFATIQHLAVTVDVMAYLKGRQIVVPLIAVDHPVIDARREDGKPNWVFPALASKPGAAAGAGPQIGDLQISEGSIHLLDPSLKADVAMDVATSARRADGERQIEVTAKGTYADQPITGRATGGALLTLRDATHPYPIDLEVANGPTRIHLAGTVLNPMAFAGADVKLTLSGPDMKLLYPLTAIPLPKTPSYQVSGNLDYTSGRVLFRNFNGRVGSSDLSGTVQVDIRGAKPVLTGELASHHVDLADLGGFIGSEPGRMSTPGQTPQQRQELAKAEASPRLLPTKRIDIPRLKSADIHIKYRGDQIIGRGVPFDRMTAVLDIDDGRIRLTPLSLGVGRGQIEGTIDLAPANDALYRLRANVGVQHVDLGRLLAATGMTNGSGTVGGRAAIDSTGNSVATFAANGDGSVQLVMSGGGDLSALLVDLSGLQFGNALLSALGIPARDQIRCFVGDWALRHGVLSTRTMILDTASNVVSGSGDVNLDNEMLDYHVATKSKHFSIGTMPTPIAITGSFKHPSIRPEAVPLLARGAAAVGLGFLFPPAALLPTIQFGVGDDAGCAPLAHRQK
ncbi:AsmA family protein [Rhodopila sp.]|uniref:AsmA family protein n=1 Tax=Rhodopila sp. TaxID=2480087 RepID=UPI002D7E8B37|nr:AsmA family protein [Rhodopila sp.]